MVHTSAFNRISQLEASKGGKNPNATLPSGGKRKSEVLKQAGLSTSVTQRCETIAGIPIEKFEERIAEIKVRAARRIGEITRELDKTHGNRYVESAPDAPSKKEVLKQAGISKEEASRCERIASLVRRTKQNPHGKLPSTGKFKTEVLKKAGISTQDAGLAKLAASLKQQITKDLDQYFPALGSTRVKH